MKKAIFLLAILLAGAPATQARMGETLAECKQRYGEAKTGKATPPANEAYTFKKNGVGIKIELMDDKVVYIEYRRDLDDASAKFTDEEIIALLEANAEGSRWPTRTDRGITSYTGRRADKKVEADIQKWHLEIWAMKWRYPDQHKSDPTKGNSLDGF